MSTTTFRPTKDKPLLPFQKRASHRETTTRKWTFGGKPDETKNKSRRSIILSRLSSASGRNYSDEEHTGVPEGARLHFDTPEGSDTGNDSLSRSKSETGSECPSSPQVDRGRNSNSGTDIENLSNDPTKITSDKCDDVTMSADYNGKTVSSETKGSENFDTGALTIQQRTETLEEKRNKLSQVEELSKHEGPSINQLSKVDRSSKHHETSTNQKHNDDDDDHNSTFTMSKQNMTTESMLRRSQSSPEVTGQVIQNSTFITDNSNIPQECELRRSPRKRSQSSHEVTDQVVQNSTFTSNSNLPQECQLRRSPRKLVKSQSSIGQSSKNVTHKPVLTLSESELGISPRKQEKQLSLLHKDQRSKGQALDSISNSSLDGNEKLNVKGKGKTSEGGSTRNDLIDESTKSVLRRSTRKTPKDSVKHGISEVKDAQAVKSNKKRKTVVDSQSSDDQSSVGEDREKDYEKNTDLRQSPRKRVGQLDNQMVVPKSKKSKIPVKNSKSKNNEKKQFVESLSKDEDSCKSVEESHAMDKNIHLETDQVDSQSEKESVNSRDKIQTGSSNISRKNKYDTSVEYKKNEVKQSTTKNNKANTAMTAKNSDEPIDDSYTTGRSRVSTAVNPVSINSTVQDQSRTGVNEDRGGRAEVTDKGQKINPVKDVKEKVRSNKIQVRSTLSNVEEIVDEAIKQTTVPQSNQALEKVGKATQQTTKPPPDQTKKRKDPDVSNLVEDEHVLSESLNEGTCSTVSREDIFMSSGTENSQNERRENVKDNVIQEPILKKVRLSENVAPVSKLFRIGTRSQQNDISPLLTKVTKAGQSSKVTEMAADDSDVEEGSRECSHVTDHDIEEDVVYDDGPSQEQMMENSKKRNISHETRGKDKAVKKKKVQIMSDSPRQEKTVRLWRGEDRTRTSRDVIDLDVILDSITDITQEKRSSCDSNLEKKALNSLLVYMRKEITNTINKIEDFKYSKKDLTRSKREVKALREKYIDLQKEKASLVQKIKVLQKKDKSRLKKINNWVTDMTNLMQIKPHRQTSKVVFYNFGSLPTT